MRSIRGFHSPATSLAALVVGLTAAVAACSSAPESGPSSPIYHPGEGSSGSPSGSGGNGESSSGATSSSGAGTSSGTGSSGGATSSSGSSSGAATGGTTISANTTWMTGQTITENTTIASGVTVTIAPGASITVSSGVAITIDGTLTATTSTTHAILTGTGWTGLVVAAGGTLNVNSLDITGASIPLDVTGTAEYDVGTITGGTTPIKVEAAGTLTMKTATVVKAGGESTFAGTFTASYLDYDSNGNEGILVSGGSFTTTDSTFHGTNDVSGDMITSSGPSSITMLYSTITACHCAYHFNAVTSFDIENMDVHGDSYGFMMYGSSTTAGTREVKNSNFVTNAAAGIDESGTNGAITVTGCYFDTADKLQLSDQEITITTPATAALTTVGPRPAQ